MELEKTNALEKRYAVLGELTARLSHDLRNPLSVIQTVSALHLKKPTTDETELSKRNDMLIKAIHRMTNQIDDVLSFVKQSKLSLADSSLLKCIENTCSEIILPENIKLNLPSNDFTIPVDTQKIEIAFINIIRNAIESIGNESGEINIELSESNTEILISFTNTGSDIPDSNLDKIFEPLFTTKETGTGLGLISTKVIVETHGGSIQVKNNPTCFTIRLPKP
jgi:two-component system sensor histidine kinase HydH